MDNHRRDASIKSIKKSFFELHHMIRQGLGDGEKADSVREMIMWSMAELSSLDKHRLNEFSGDLSGMDDQDFYFLKSQFDMDPRMIRIYWRFQFIRSGLNTDVRETERQNYYRWEVGDRSLSFELGEGNVIHMSGHRPFPAIDPTIEDTKKAMSWLLGKIYIPITYCRY